MTILVCKSWNEISESNEPWEKIYHRNGWPLPDSDAIPLKKWFLENTFLGEVNTWKLDKKRRLQSKYGPDLRILMLGLDMAGKTALLYKLKLNDVVATIPTIGFNVESIQYRRKNLTIWDVGGQDKIRPLWKHYFLDSQVIIFVVDVSVPERLDEAREELSRLSSEEDLRKNPPLLLVVLNKTDLLFGKEDVLTPRSWANKLDLRKHSKFFPKIYVHSISATTQSATELKVLLDWIVHHVEKRKK